MEDLGEKRIMTSITPQGFQDKFQPLAWHSKPPKLGLEECQGEVVILSEMPMMESLLPY